MSTTVLRSCSFVVGALLPRIPGPLVAVLLAAAASALLALDRVGTGVVGQVPEGLPVPAVPAITPGDLALLLPAALGVAVVAYSDNVLTARAFAAKQRHPLDSDQELLALGAANLATGFLQGFPVSSSASRTTVGHAVGGRSRLTSVVALLAVLVVLTVGGPVLAALPTAALGALVVYAALRLVDVAELHRIGRFRRSELVHRPRHDDRGAPRRSALRRVDRGRAVDPRSAAAGLPPARRGAGLRSGPRRHARHRRLPERGDRSRRWPG
jgi:MFS superfamily sulfate permease-like transporter